MKKIEISRKDLKNNLDLIINIASSNGKDDNGNQVKIIAVVKSNGMGLGLVKYSKFLINNGITCIAVATTEEAIRLRKANIKEEILLLSPTTVKKELKELLEKDIILTVSSSKDIEIIEKLAISCKKTVNAHLKIDTGMGRYGFLYDNKEDILKAFKSCKNIKILGTYTHFSKPIDEKWTKKQFDRFLDVIHYLKKENIECGILHCAASTAFIKYKIMRLNAVRIGSAIQGRTLIPVNGLVKVGRFKTSITEIKTLPKGYNIGYNNTYKTKKAVKIAIIPVGLNDGFNKDKLRDSFSLKENILSVGIETKRIFKENSLKAYINEKEYKLIGTIGLNHCVIDITKSEDVKIGDEVSLDLSPLKANENIMREYI